MALKILSTLNFITGSSAATPSSGYGSVYASGSFLYYKNDAGTEYNLTSGRENILYYSSSTTWVKPLNITSILVCCIGAGGGGGSGRVGIAGASRSGGTGGCGGAYVIRKFIASELVGPTYTITVGSKGTGGAVRTGTGNGLAGTAGTGTSFTSGSTVFVSASGGPAGGGGAGSALSGPLGLQASVQVPAGLPFAIGQGNAANSSITGTPVVSTAFLTTTPAANAGGSISSSNLPLRGGSGPAMYITGSLISGPTGSVASGSGAVVADGINNAKFDLMFGWTTNQLTYSYGGTPAGGTSGDAAGTINGSKGGNGGNFGAAGAGGGAATNPVSSGAGGDGADGLCIIIEYY